jgi:DNA-binding NarL/FixJ family response regulator
VLDVAKAYDFMPAISWCYAAGCAIVDRTRVGTLNRACRILLVEDHATVRAGLRLLLESEPDLEVVAEASDGAVAVQRGQAENIDLVIMDVSMPGVSGLMATRRLKQLRPDIKVVALTRHADQTYVRELLRAGVSGYVLKQSAHTELLHAIRAAAAGRQHIDSSLTRHVAAPFVAASMHHADDAPRGITPRETDVLRLTAQGHSNKEIAERLDVSVKTVEVHKTNAMRKLGLSGRIQLLQFAVVQGWLNQA